MPGSSIVHDDLVYWMILLGFLSSAHPTVLRFLKNAGELKSGKISPCVEMTEIFAFRR